MSGRSVFNGRSSSKWRSNIVSRRGRPLPMAKPHSGPLRAAAPGRQRLPARLFSQGVCPHNGLPQPAHKRSCRVKKKRGRRGGRKKAAQLNGIPLHNALGEAGRPVAAPSAPAVCVSPPGSDAFARGKRLKQKEDGKKERRGIRWRAVSLRHAFKMSQCLCRWPRTEVVHHVSEARERVSSGRELCSGNLTFEPAEKDKDKNLGSLQC